MEVDYPETATSGHDGLQPRLVIFISSGAAYLTRRNSLRKSWFRYLTDPDSPVPPHLRACVTVQFVLSREAESQELAAEQAQHGDLVFVEAPEGYGNLWRKALVYMLALEERNGPQGQGYEYLMHADDDSFVRLDLLLPLLAGWPRTRHYWGYIWDGTGNRVTQPIRNPANKSYMPQEQYPLDYYPPFASGCGFVLSRDLVRALLAQPLPDYRLLDPPFGIHLCGRDACVLLDGPVTPVHDERVRPYRPLPTFRADTLVQHYLRPEEMRPFYLQAWEAAQKQQAAADGSGPSGSHQGQELASGLDPGGVLGQGQGQGQGPAADAPTELYNTLVSLGIWRR